MKIIILLLLLASCSSNPVVEKPTWRIAYINRKPVSVNHGVPFYPEHMEYLKRNVYYTCLSGIKPMLPVEFTNDDATSFCGCMTDAYYTPDQVRELLIKFDFDPSKVVTIFKEVQNEYWAVMDDEFKKNYREIVKYPPGYYERITQARATCIDDINYKKFNNQVSRIRQKVEPVIEPIGEKTTED